MSTPRLILLTLIASGVFISGLYLRAWKLCVVAAFLAVAVPIVAWVEQAALLLLIIAGGIALGLAAGGRRDADPRRMDALVSGARRPPRRVPSMRQLFRLFSSGLSGTLNGCRFGLSRPPSGGWR
jgi:hypothetical protein